MPNLSLNFHNSRETKTLLSECVKLEDIDVKNTMALKKWKHILKKGGKPSYNAFFILGPMGVGKSTFIQNKILTNPEFSDYIYFNADEIMSSLDGFCAQNVDEFYKICRPLTLLLTDWIMKKGFAFVTEGTCSQYKELWDYMIRLKEHKYTISVLFLEEPLNF
ncbi:LOW QUALITY PROTEIN: hypothetical protein HZS_1653 [Henneguya salminicola]|nr:LOW QUALITY PROTEIN: hypothetical protein HZS_1653 [Henneguya salminicola]